MARIQNRIPKPTLLIGLLLFGLILLFAPARLTNVFNAAFIKAFGFCLSIDTGQTSVRSPRPGLEGNYVPRTVHEQLLIDYDNLLADLIEMRARYQKLANLRMELPRPGTRLVLAEIINRSTMAQQHEIIIDKGSENHIAPGQYVLGNNTIIAKVSTAYDTDSRCRLLTDASSRLPIKIAVQSEGKYINSVMFGTGSDVAVIPNLPRKYSIEKGYTVYADKVPGLLSTPRTVGYISKCEISEHNPLLWYIEVKPAVNYEKIKDVAVIVARTGNGAE